MKIRWIEKIKASTEHVSLLRSAVGSYALLLASVAFSFGVSIFLARLLGVSGFGLYAYVMAIIFLLERATLMGMPGILTREISAYKVANNYNALNGILYWAFKKGVYNSLAVIFLAIIVLKFLVGKEGSDGVIAFYLGFILLFLMTVNDLRAAVLRGVGNVVLAEVPENLIRPFLFLSIILIIYTNGWPADVPLILALQIATGIIAVAIGLVWMYKKLPAGISRYSPVYKRKYWFNAALPLFAVGTITVLNYRLDLVILGTMSSEASVGIYRVASRISELVLFFTMAGNNAVASAIPRLFSDGSMEKLEKLSHKWAMYLSLAALPQVIILSVFGKVLINFFFGEEFVSGYLVLVVLCVTHLICMSFGPVEFLLSLTRFERDSLKAAVISVVLNIFLNVILIHKFDAIGAAIATSASLLCMRGIQTYYVLKRMKIKPFAWSVKQSV